MLLISCFIHAVNLTHKTKHLTSSQFNILKFNKVQRIKLPTFMEYRIERKHNIQTFAEVFIKAQLNPG